MAPIPSSHFALCTSHSPRMYNQNSSFSIHLKRCDLQRALQVEGSRCETDAAPATVTGDNLREQFQEPEKNPALGLRAIRFVLANEDVMRGQIRAILRAAAFKVRPKPSCYKSCSASLASTCRCTATA